MGVTASVYGKAPGAAAAKHVADFLLIDQSIKIIMGQDRG
jgi:hypothetical protein